MLTRAAVALVLSFSLPHAAAARTQGASVSPLFEAAVKAQQAGDFATAETDYKQLLTSEPRNVEALANLGVVYVNLGRYDDAIASYRKALEISYLNTPVRMNLGLAFYKAARYAEAIPEFDRVLDTSPGLYSAVLLKADCLLQLGRPGDAATLLKPIAGEHDDDAAFAYVYGMALLQDKQTDQGLAYLDKILRRGESAEAHLLMGLAKQAAADYAEAREEFRKAVALNGELPMAHSLLGQALLRTGDRDAAKSAFEQELAINPNDFESQLYLGVIQKEASEFDAALAHFTRAETLRPGDFGVRYQIASLLVARGDTDAALPKLEALVKEAPTFVEAHVSLATVYYRLKRREDGDREKAIVAKLQSGADGAKGAGAKGAVGAEGVTPQR
jgi:tetratricopeptide (TPR) repeat protein